MYILVELDPYYPSVIHFNTQGEAEEFAEKKALNGSFDAYYIAKVEISYIGEQSGRKEKQDIEWNISNNI